MSAIRDARPVRQLFPWKVFWSILILTLIAAALKIPAVIFTIGAVNQPQDWPLISTVSILQDFIPFGLISAAIGLLLINRAGFNLPFVRGSFTTKPKMLGEVILTALLSALILAVINILILLLVKPLVQNDFSSHGLKLSDFEGVTQTPLWTMALASFSAGVLEETGFRLGLVTLVTCLIGLFWKGAEGHPRAAAIWVSIFLVALLFGALHLSNITALGLPLTFSLILYALAGNSIPGVVFGWLYWKRGLESAILAHMTLNLLTHVLFPAILQLFALQ